MLPHLLLEAQNSVVDELQLIQFSRILTRLFLEVPMKNFGSNAPNEKEEVINFLWEIRLRIENLHDGGKYAFILKYWDLYSTISRENIISLMTRLKNTDSLEKLRESARDMAKYTEIKAAVDSLILSTTINNHLLSHNFKKEIDSIQTINFEIVNGSEGIDFVKFIIIVEAIKDLYISVNLLYAKPLDEPKIQFIESGSNILIAVKSAKETAGFILGALRFYYKYVKNFEFLSQKMQAESALGHLAVNKEIAVQAELGYLDEDRAKKLSRAIVDKIEKLYNENVVLADYHIEDVSPKNLLAHKEQPKLTEGSSNLDAENKKSSDD